MKQILFISLMCFFGAMNDVCAQQQQPKFVYCQIASFSNSPLSLTGVVVNFGDNMKQYETRIMSDASGKKVRLNGVVNALNFMARQGWELDQASAIPINGTTGTSNFHFLYILKKPFADLEENEKQEFLKN